jgi:hypothetical protein
MDHVVCHQCVGAAVARRLKDRLVIRVIQLGTPAQMRFAWLDQGREGA